MLHNTPYRLIWISLHHQRAHFFECEQRTQNIFLFVSDNNFVNDSCTAYIDDADGALNIIVFEVSAYVDETRELSPALFGVRQFSEKT